MLRRTPSLGMLLGLLALALTAATPARSVAAPPAAPKAPRLTDAERGALARGELVLRRTAGGGEGLAGSLQGLLEIAATEQRTWETILDFAGQDAADDALQIERYGGAPLPGGGEGFGLAFRLRVFVRTVRYHLRHEHWPQLRLLTWTLDPSRPNDVERIDGSLASFPGSTPGRTLLVYRAAVDSGGVLPEFVKRYLATKALEDYLEGIRRRAEG